MSSIFTIDSVDGKTTITNRATQTSFSSASNTQMGSDISYAFSYQGYPHIADMKSLLAGLPGLEPMWAEQMRQGEIQYALSELEGLRSFVDEYLDLADCGGPSEISFNALMGLYKEQPKGNEAEREAKALEEVLSPMQTVFRCREDVNRGLSEWKQHLNKRRKALESKTNDPKAGTKDSLEERFEAAIRQAIHAAEEVTDEAALGVLRQKRIDCPPLTVDDFPECE